MSFNESLLSNSNYPPMSQSEWDSAPWSEEELPEREFNIMISQTLSKNTTVCTTDYETYYEEEDGSVHVETNNTDWVAACDRSEVYTPLELIGEFKKFLLEQLETVPATSRKAARYRILIRECENWNQDDIEIMEDK